TGIPAKGDATAASSPVVADPSPAVPEASAPGPSVLGSSGPGPSAPGSTAGVAPVPAPSAVESPPPAATPPGAVVGPVPAACCGSSAGSVWLVIVHSLRCRAVPDARTPGREAPTVSTGSSRASQAPTRGRDRTATEGGASRARRRGSRHRRQPVGPEEEEPALDRDDVVRVLGQRPAPLDRAVVERDRDQPESRRALLGDEERLPVRED